MIIRLCSDLKTKTRRYAVNGDPEQIFEAHELAGLYSSHQGNQF